MIIVLFQPEIPQNTGNVVRTAAAMGCSLKLVEPLGFSISDRWLKRAGLDYWDKVDIEVVPNLETVLKNASGTPYFFSSKAKKLIHEVTYASNDLLIFGSETKGLPQKITERYKEQCVKIPMVDGIRCLNLATAVGIGVYEALRVRS